MTDTELADRLEDQANALLPTDEQGAETLLAMADEYRAGGTVDAMIWRAVA